MAPEEQSLLSSHAEPTRRPRWLGLLLALVTFVAWFVAGGYVLRSLGIEHLSLLPNAIISQCGLLLALLVGMATDGLGFRFHFKPLKADGWIDWVAIPVLIGWHLFGSAIFGVIMVILYKGKMPKPPVADLLKALGGMSGLQILGTALLLAALAGVLEELLFRGYFVSRLRALGLPPLLAGALPALLFGLIHVPAYGWANSIPKALGLGLASGLYVGWRQRLWPAMAAHFLIDFLAFLLLGVAFKMGLAGM